MACFEKCYGHVPARAGARTWYFLVLVLIPINVLARYRETFNGCMCKTFKIMMRHACMCVFYLMLNAMFYTNRLGLIDID